MRYLITLFILISFVSGCRNQSQLIRHDYATNYKIGEEKTAYIGQSIVKVKDYYVYKGYESTALEPTEDFTLTAIVPTFSSVYNLNISGLKGKKYEVWNKIKVDGILYNLLYFTDSNGHNTYGVLIDDKGNIKNNTIYGYGKTPTYFKLQPSNVKFNKSIITEENFLCDAFINYGGNTCGWINYELIYSGINNVSMNIMYREYSRNDYAKPAFYQNLTFEPNAKQIRFKDFIIEIIKATNDKIEYKILSDSLNPTEFSQGEDKDFERIKYSK